jgi:hypothetical protein
MGTTVISTALMTSARGGEVARAVAVARQQLKAANRVHLVAATGGAAASSSSPHAGDGRGRHHRHCALAEVQSLDLGTW